MKKKIKPLIIVLTIIIIFGIGIFLYKNYSQNTLKKGYTIKNNKKVKTKTDKSDITIKEVENKELPKEENEENENENKNKNLDVKEITLNGEKYITIKQNSTYKELGAKATNNNGEDISEYIEISSEVDTSKKGEYKVFYSIGNWINVRYVTIE